MLLVTLPSSKHSLRIFFNFFVYVIQLFVDTIRLDNANMVYVYLAKDRCGLNIKQVLVLTSVNTLEERNHKCFLTDTSKKNVKPLHCYN